MYKFLNQTQQRRKTETIGFFVFLHTPLLSEHFRSLTASTNRKRFNLLGKSILENPRRTRRWPRSAIRKTCTVRRLCYYFFYVIFDRFSLDTFRSFMLPQCNTVTKTITTIKRKEKGQKSVSTVSGMCTRYITWKARPCASALYWNMYYIIIYMHIYVYKCVYVCYILSTVDNKPGRPDLYRFECA